MQKLYHFVERHEKLLIFAPNFQIDVELMRYVKALDGMLAPNSRRTYLRQLMPWLNFLHATSPGKQIWNLDPIPLRHKVHQFLTQEYRCQINFAQFHEDAFLVKELGVKNGRASLFLSALNHFYKVMRWLGLYPHKRVLKLEMEDEFERTGPGLTKRMPLKSGCELPDLSRQMPYRLSSSYFVCVDEQWTPKTLDDPAFPRLINDGGVQINWSQREILIFRMLFETGARISEILGLTLADWVKYGCAETASTFSKGSGHARVKTLRWSRETTNLLINYFNTQRRECDPNQWTLNQFISRHDEALFSNTFLFLNRYARPVLPSSYRSLYWRPAARIAGIRATIQQARHWFVTSYMRTIYDEAKTSSLDDPHVSQAIGGLVSYMAWKSGEKMVGVYNHHLARETTINYSQRVHDGLSNQLNLKPEPHEKTHVSTTSQLADDMGLQTIFALTEKKK